MKSGISGVSSFGFGGTNARGDLWGRCVKGAKKTELLDTGVWVLQRQLFYDRVFHYGHPGEMSGPVGCGRWGDGFCVVK